MQYITRIHKIIPHCFIFLLSNHCAVGKDSLFDLTTSSSVVEFILKQKKKKLKLLVC